MENQENEIDKNVRDRIIADVIIKRLTTMFVKHVHLQDAEAAGLYLASLTDAVNQRIPSGLTRDHFEAVCGRVWDGITHKVKTKYWPSISDVVAVASKISQDVNRTMSIDKKVTHKFKGEVNPEENRVKGQGWTEAGAWAALKHTDELISSGELGRGMGMRLRRIPIVALSRMNIEVDDTPPALAPVPTSHVEPPLPPAPAPPETKAMKPIMSMDKSELNMRLIVDGATAPKFDDTPLVEDELPDALTSNWDNL
jgi:hypothetical protein